MPNPYEDRQEPRDIPQELIDWLDPHIRLMEARTLEVKSTSRRMWEKLLAVQVVILIAVLLGVLLASATRRTTRQLQQRVERLEALSQPTSAIPDPQTSLPPKSNTFP